MCGTTRLLRTVGDGLLGDGICEQCDFVRFQVMYPLKTWRTWSEQREMLILEDAKRKTVLAPMRVAVPSVQAADEPTIRDLLRVS